MTIIPTIIEKTTKWERAYDIYSRLLEDRIIFVWEPVSSGIVNTVVAQLLYLEKKDPDKDITMYINTPWWEVYSWMAIFDTMQYVKCDVATVATWLAASMWSIFIAWGTKWKRFSLPHSRIMIHQPLISWWWISWQASDIEIEAKEMLRIKKMLNDLIAEKTWKTAKTVEKDMERNNRMTPEEAKKYWLIDKIIAN